MTIVEKVNKEEYVEFFLDIFQILNIPYDLRIKGRLREFIIYSMMMYYEDWDLDSPEAVLEVSERMNFKNSGEVYNYRQVLKKKNFFFQTKDGVQLIAPLCLKKIHNKVNYNFRVQINE